MKRLGQTLIVFAVLFVSAQAFAQPYRIKKKTDFTFENLVETLDGKQVRTIEALLPLLPREFLTEYVLMYKSRSLQEASFKFPRVLMYGNDATLMMAFNGHASQNGFDSLEVIQFRQKSSSFEFHEITFDGKNRPSVSEANPAKCVKCHQSSTRTNVDMRPNWEPYDIWPGAYGSVSGRLYLYPEDLTLMGKRSAGNRELIELLSFVPSENEQFELQSPKWHKHARYGHLSLATKDTIHDNVLALTQRATQLNFARVSRLMRASEFAAVALPLVEARLRCEDKIEDFLPPALARALKQKDRRLKVRYSSPDRGLGALASVYEPGGIDTSDWSMSFNTEGRFAFSSPFGTPTQPDREFAEVV
ncbi:MAG: hypothetical protein ABL958_03920, partial [Bdellovibrionia bacterium]